MGHGEGVGPVVVGDVPVVFAYGEGESNHVVQVKPSEQRQTVKADGVPAFVHNTIQQTLLIHLSGL